MYACAEPETGQYAKWDECMRLVLEHERGDGSSDGSTSHAPPYDFLFKSRPDIMWTVPLPLHSIAGQLDPQTILTGNDVHVLLPRATWHVLQSLHPERLSCAHTCGRKHPLARWLPGGGYCHLIYALADAGVPHVEASHPEHLAHLLQTTTDVYGFPSWAAGLRYRVHWDISRYEQAQHWLTPLADALLGCQPPCGKRWPELGLWLTDPVAMAPSTLLRFETEAQRWAQGWILAHVILGATVCHHIEPHRGGRSAPSLSERRIQCQSCRGSLESIESAINETYRARASRGRVMAAVRHLLAESPLEGNDQGAECPPVVTMSTAASGGVHEHDARRSVWSANAIVHQQRERLHALQGSLGVRKTTLQAEERCLAAEADRINEKAEAEPAGSHGDGRITEDSSLDCVRALLAEQPLAFEAPEGPEPETLEQYLEWV